MKKLVACSVIILLAAALAPSGPATPEKEAIRAVLEAQKEAWNRGDIEGFMATYWQSDDLTFQSGNSRVQGWSNVLARYKRTYGKDNMGRLDFVDLSVHLLAPDAAYVLGRFKLDLGGKTKEGVFTLILKRSEAGWRIIHDHTSS
jgi:uncharacterized protein (TIGR02246 family)